MSQNLQPQTDIEIDGIKYVVQLYGPTFGTTLWAKLLSILGEPFIKVVATFKSSGTTTVESALTTLDVNSLNLDEIGEALQSLFSHMRPDEVVPLMKEILSSTFFKETLEPVGSRFETAFAGKYLHLFKLVGKTVGVQYADFLSGLKKRANAGKGVTASAPKAVKSL